MYIALSSIYDFIFIWDYEKFLRYTMVVMVNDVDAGYTESVSLCRNFRGSKKTLLNGWLAVSKKDEMKVMIESVGFGGWIKLNHCLSQYRQYCSSNKWINKIPEINVAD